MENPFSTSEFDTLNPFRFPGSLTSKLKENVLFARWRVYVSATIATTNYDTKNSNCRHDVSVYGYVCVCGGGGAAESLCNQLLINYLILYIITSE